MTPSKMLLMAIVSTCTPFVSTHAQDEKIGAFTIHRETDAISDESSVVVYTRSSDVSRKARLQWQCDDSSPTVVYIFNTPFFDDVARIRYRIDSNPSPQTDGSWAVWFVRGRQRAAALQGQFFYDDFLEFTRAALVGKKIIIEATDPVSQAQVRDTFSLVGLTAGLKKLDCMEGTNSQ